MINLTKYIKSAHQRFVSDCLDDIVGSFVPFNARSRRGYSTEISEKSGMMAASGGCADEGWGIVVATDGDNVIVKAVLWIPEVVSEEWVFDTSKVIDTKPIEIWLMEKGVKSDATTE